MPLQPGHTRKQGSRPAPSHSQLLDKVMDMWSDSRNERLRASAASADARFASPDLRWNVPDQYLERDEGETRADKRQRVDTTDRSNRNEDDGDDQEDLVGAGRRNIDDTWDFLRQGADDDNNDNNADDGIGDPHDTGIGPRPNQNRQDLDAASTGSASDCNGRKNRPVPLVMYHRGMIEEDRASREETLRIRQQILEETRALDDEMLENAHKEMRDRAEDDVVPPIDEETRGNYDIVAPMGNPGVLDYMVSESTGKRIYVCELCVEGRSLSESNGAASADSDIKDGIVNYIYNSLGELPIDTIMLVAAEEYNQLVYRKNKERGIPGLPWTAQKLKNHFIGGIEDRNGHVIDPLITAVVNYHRIDTALNQVMRGARLQHPSEDAVNILDPTYTKNIVLLTKSLLAMSVAITKLKAERAAGGPGGAGAGRGAHRSATLVKHKPMNGMAGPMLQYIERTLSLTRDSHEARLGRASMAGGIMHAGADCYSISNY